MIKGVLDLAMVIEPAARRCDSLTMFEYCGAGEKIASGERWSLGLDFECSNFSFEGLNEDQAWVVGGVFVGGGRMCVGTGSRS